MSIIDITTFNNQIELLDLRIKILEDVVDVFYIVEAPITHQGQPKELLGDKYRHPKLRVVTIEFPPEFRGDWDFENYQRAHPIDLSEYDPNSLVLTSDLDEIPDPNCLLWLRETFDPRQIYCLQQSLSQYYLNVRNLSEDWYGTRVCSIENYNLYNAQKLRFIDGIRLQQAGWHFSYIGGKEAIAKKMTENARHQFSIPEALRLLEQRMDNNEDVFGRGHILRTVPVDESFPVYVRENQDKLSHLIKDYNE